MLHENICPWYNKANILWVKKQLILWKVLRKHKRVWVWHSAVWNLLGVWKKYAGTKDYDFLNWRKQKWEKNCVDLFYYQKKKVKKRKCWFIPQKTKLCCFVFLRKKHQQIEGIIFFGEFCLFLKLQKNTFFMCF